ncbi:MAG: hypothetical protein D4R97_00375, partial [Bacteroidetes bacterium]
NNNLVLASVLVNNNGTYSFGASNGVLINTNYKLILTTTAQAPGTALTAATYPAHWVSTGENLGAGAGNDGTVDGILAVNTNSGSVVNANFGIVKLPDITPNITVSPNVMAGITNFDVTVKVTELNMVNTNGVITVIIPKDSRWVLNGSFNPSLTNLISTSLNNADWSYSSDASYHIFTTTSVIPAGSFSTFGFKATFTPGNTKGLYTITSQILSGSGGENRTNNNVDSEKLDYFFN